MNAQPHFYWLRRTLGTCAVLILIALPSQAQITTGSVIGQVRDQTNKPLDDVIVTVINAQNRNKRATRSNDSGSYVVPNLPPGTYHLIARKDGFAMQCIASFQVLFNKNNAVKYPPHFTLPKQNNVSNNPTCEALLKQQTATIEKPSQLAFAITPPDRNRARRLQSQVFLLPSLQAQVRNSNPLPTAAQASDNAAANSLVNTSDVTRSSNFTEQQLTSLPIGAASYLRSFDELVLLAPGVAPPPYTPGTRGPGVGFGIGSAGQFSVNGMRARSNNFSIDGTDNNDPDVGVRRGGYVAQALQSVGSVAEVSISTLLWSAEVGRNFGSQVNAVSKYGSTNYHGQIEGFFTDSRMKAREYFEAKENPLTRTQAGASLSGPLLSSRTQFFLGVESGKTNASVTEQFATPNTEVRESGGLSLQFPCPRFDQYYLCAATRMPSQIPLLYYPAANNPSGIYGANTFSQVLPSDGAGAFSSLRVTQQITAAHSLNVKYSITDEQRVLPSVNQAIRSTINSRTRGQNLSLLLDSQFAPRIFQQARASFGRTRMRFPEHRLGPFTVADIDPSMQSFFALLPLEYIPDPFGRVIIRTASHLVGEIQVQPFSPLGVNTILFPQGRVNNNFQFADTLAWQQGQHAFKAGADVRRVQFNNFQDRLYRTQMQYSYGWKEAGQLDIVREPTQTNFRFTPQQRTAASSLALNMMFPSSTLQTLTSGTPDSHISLRLTESLFFLTDTWQLRPRVTLVAGLRYEYTSVPHDATGRIEDALTLRNLPQPTANNTPQERANYEAILNAYAQVLGGRTQMYNPDRNNFGPQFGLAWGFGKANRTALRAGYGVYYDAILGAVISQSRNLFPNQIPVGLDRPMAGEIAFPANCSTIVCETVGLVRYARGNQLQGGASSFVSNLATLANQMRAGLAFSLPAQNLPTPLAQQWHVTFEREVTAQTVVTIGYIGTRGHRLTRITTPNFGPQNTPVVQSGSVTYLADNTTRVTTPALLMDTATLLLPPRPNANIGSYQIFQNAANSSYHALQIEATKRYGKQLNFTAAYTWSHAIDEVSDIFPISGAPIVAQNQRNPRSERGNANFDLRHRFTTSVTWEIPKLNGWQLAAIVQAQTGQPFTINLPIDANLDGNLSDRPATLQGLQLINGNRERVRLASGATLNDFLVQGQDGIVGRNTFRGARFVNFDVSLAKTFRWAEQRQVMLKAEVFNLFNRANFGLPVRTLDAPGFGSAVATVNPARILQLAIKLNF
jgi:Carboxypeptidase regulatory-like domain